VKLTKSSIKMLAVAGMTVLMHQAAVGQSVTGKPIRIVTDSPGGGSDFTSRLIGQELTSRQGQVVVVDNRPAGIIPGEVVYQAPADGNTLLVAANSFWLQKYMRDKMPYDPIKDFSPVIYTNRGPNILVVTPSLPANSVQELVALAKAKPRTIAFASSATGSIAHIAVELFRSMAGIEIVHVPYKGIVQANTAVMSGDVQVIFTTLASVTGLIKSGKLKALAITTAQPSVLFPELPTVAASGFPGYELVTVTGLLAPAKTPRAVIERLNADIAQILNEPAVKERYLNLGVEVVGGPPEQFEAAIQRDMTVLGKVIKDAGIHVE